MTDLNDRFDDGWMDLGRYSNSSGAWIGGGVALIFATIYALQVTPQLNFYLNPWLII